MHVLEEFLNHLRPLLRANGALQAWVFGSRARGDAAPESDIDVIVVAPSPRPFTERFRDYLPAIIAADAGVDLLVYTTEEIERLRREERPFLVDALRTAVPIEF